MRFMKRKRLTSRRRDSKDRAGRRLFLESLETRVVMTGLHDLTDTAIALPNDLTSTSAQTPSALVAEGEHDGQATHIHTHLTIFVDGTQVVIPESVGVSDSAFLSQVHTHDDTGELHIHAINTEPRDQTLTLGAFFDTWRTNAGLAGNRSDAVLSANQLFDNVTDTTSTLKMFVNGQPADDYQNHVFHDGDDIILAYGSDPVVSLNTNFGSIVVELFETETPGTVNNFLNYVNDGDYINSFFHRSADSGGTDFVIQGGGFSTPSTTFTNTAQFSSVPTDAPIQNEPGISNLRGTIAMAKTSNPDSATSQFFVNLADTNTFLDSPSNSGGFTVFGQVLDLRSSDEIAALPIRPNPSPYGELPVDDNDQLVVIQSIAGRGEISGIHFNDDNQNGSLDPGESAISAATIFIDANDNGVLDPGELSTATDATGRYLFQLDPGSYTVRAVFDSSLQLTVPSTSDSYSVTVEIGREAADRNFGVAVDDDTPAAQADAYSVNEDAVLTVTAANGVLANDTSRTTAPLTAVINTQPANGSLTLSSDGSLSYTPNANFFGTDTFTYTATDGTNQSNSTAVTLTVNAQPDAPVAVADAITLSNSRTARTVDLTGNDTSAPDADQTLTVTAVTQGTSGGTVALSGGVVTYLAPEGFIGTDTFTYTIQDTDGLQSSATATVTVTEVADNSLSGFVYIDADGDGLRSTGEVGVPGAQITLTGAGLTQTILTDTNGAYSFTGLPAGTYQLVERQPVALLDGTDSTTVPNATVGNDVISVIALDGGQDFAENNFGEAGIQSQYVNIMWFFASAGSPEAMFRETIAMGEEMDGDATLAATIRAGGTEVPDGTNSAPIATGDSYTIDENGVLTVTAASGVLNNDTDVDGDSLTAVVVSQPANGTLSLSGDGSFTYTPNSEFFGSDTFTYQTSDGTDLSNTATVTITVNEVDSSNTFSLAENSAAGTLVGQVTPATSLGNEVVFTFDDSTLSPELELAADDHITGNPEGSVVLIEYVDFQCPVCRTFHPIVEQLETNFPDDLAVVTRHLPLTSVHPNAFVAAVAAEAAGRQGDFDAFGDLLFDNQDDWDTASDPQSFFEIYATQLGLDLTQFRADQADAAVADRVTRDSDAAGTLGATGTPTFFLNGEQISNPGSQATFDALIQTEVDQNTDVFSLDRQTGEIFVRDSAALDFETMPSFSFVVNAIGLNASEQVSVRVDLTNVNDAAPVAAADSYSVDENATLTIASSQGVLNNDTDSDGDLLTAQQVTGPTSGTLTLNADGSFTYAPNLNFNGSDSFTYAASDGTTTSAAATVTITVNSTNSAPVTSVDTYTLDEDSSLTVDAANGVLINDSDPEGDSLTAVLVEGPQNGAVSLNADGSFTYTPIANFSATDAFTYAASDGAATSGATTVTLLVQGVEDTPVAEDDSYSLDQAGLLNIAAASGVLANDTDVDADTLTALLLSNPSNGTLTLNSNGSFSYEPDDVFVGTDTFTYQASDGFFVSNAATVTVTVNDINIAPGAAADDYSVDEDAILTVDAASGLLNNDNDVDNDPLTITVTSNVTDGTLSLQDDGSFTYTPNANFNGTDTFTYQLNDGTVDSNTALVTITVNSINDLPVGQSDMYSVAVDGSLTVDTASGVLDNDTDDDGDALTASVTTTTANGTLSLQSDGSFTYSPNASFHGTDSFTYTAADGTGASSATTVTIDVNTLATAAADAYTVSEDATLSVDAASGVLDNDSDVDGDSLSAAIVTVPANGTVVMSADGSFEYQPAANFNGTDTFSYIANDGFGDSAPATVTITVNPENDAAVASDDTYTTPVNQALVINAALGVLANDNDIDGDSLTVTLQTSPTDGTVTLSGDGSFTYTPNGSFRGTDTFTYLANDGTVDSNEATVTITVNTAAIAADDSYAIDEDMTLTVDAANGVLNNDNNVDGDAITAHVVSDPTNGQLTLNDDGSFDYTPDNNFNGTDQFVYVANDGTVDSAAAIVTITVNAVNDAPELSADQFTVVGEGSIMVSASQGVLSNDNDPEGDTLTATLVGGTNRGALDFNSDGSFSYTPSSGFSGSDSFTYEASDGSLTSTTATATITITPTDLVRIRLEAAASDGTPIDTIAAGQSFAVNAYVEDIRRVPQGVFAAYLDVVYDSAIASVDGAIVFSNDFANGRVGDISTPGLIDEAGAFTQSTLGAGEAILFSVPFVANSAGTLDIILDAADNFPDHDTLLRGIDNAIALDLIDFVSDSLTVTAAAGEGEASGNADYAASADEAFAAEFDWLLP